MIIFIFVVYDRLSSIMRFASEIEAQFLPLVWSSYSQHNLPAKNIVFIGYVLEYSVKIRWSRILNKQDLFVFWHLRYTITWNDMNGCFGWDHMAFSKRRSTIVLWSAPAFLSPLFLSLTCTLFKHQNTETANETNPFIFVGSLYLVISYTNA